MQRRRLGRLAHDSSVLIYGGAALGEVDQDIADASVAEALEAGSAETRAVIAAASRAPKVVTGSSAGSRGRGRPGWGSRRRP